MSTSESSAEIGPIATSVPSTRNSSDVSPRRSSIAARLRAERSYADRRMNSVGAPLGMARGMFVRFSCVQLSIAFTHAAFDLTSERS